MPEFLRLARVTAAGLASRLGFSYDEVEDLRLAIDELCFGLTGNDGRPGTVEVLYLLEGDSLIVEGSLRQYLSSGSAVSTDAPDRSGTPRPTFALSELSELILTALVDEHDFDEGSTGPHFRLMKRRQAGAAVGDPPGAAGGRPRPS